MTLKSEPTPPAIGATWPDVILRILRSPYLTIPLLALALLLVVSIATGYVELSLGETGIKFSQGPLGSAKTDLNITGNWRGQAKDLPRTMGS